MRRIHRPPVLRRPPPAAAVRRLLLLHFDSSSGTGSIATPDSSPFGSSVATPNPTSFSINTGDTMFGAGSGSFPAGSNDYLTVPYDVRFSTGAGDFTYQWFMKPTTISAGRAIFARRLGGVVCPIELQFQSTATMRLLMSDAPNTGWATVTDMAVTSATGAWQHGVCQKRGSTIGVAIGGIWSGTTATVPSLCTSTDPLYIGRGGDGIYSGLLEEFCIDDSAMYTIGTNFTPPTAPFA